MQSNATPRLIVLLLLLLLAGCAGVPEERPSRPEAGVEAARALESRGEFTGAAVAYLAAAAEARDARDRATLRLAAAKLLIRAAELDRAGQVVRSTELPPEADDLALRRNLLLAEIDLGRSRPAMALRRLPPTVSDRLPLPLRRQHLELRARALLHSGDTLASARERLLLDSMLEEPEAILTNQHALLGALRDLGPTLPEAKTVESGLAGWIALARIASGPPRHEVALEAELAEWRAAYPDHPAHPELLERVIADRAAEPTPSNIAVLLPMHGPVASAAEAIRDGFLAALFAGAEPPELAEPGQRVSVRFYDSSGSNVLNAYGDAIADGAEMVVGPLRKEAVAELASTTLPVPVLALNRLAPLEATPGGFLRQFALAPEDEAGEVAHRAWYDGHRQVVVLTPTTDFGQRVAAAFRARWEQLGGTVLETRGYDPSENDFSQPITDLLGLNASQARYRELRGLLRRSIEFEPRRRRDADAVFLVALPLLARQLKPQLAFHHAAELPVYATSHVYAPGSGPEANRDLNGVRFCDMPWTLGAADPALAGGLPAASGPRERLFALGADAFHILPYLSRMQADQGSRLDAQTGLLWLDEAGVVHRQLLCAEFREGQPQLLGYTPPLEMANARSPSADR
ncbi:MAG: penicillin-binding protein activator [Gammaproteobacteria bacterium]|nr:penicillin-binding protein activator [Gammaproteobacteria bacterium]